MPSMERWLVRLEAAHDGAERERIARLSPDDIEAELAELDRPAALQFIGRLTDRQLEALVAECPELHDLSDAELLALCDGDGP